MRRRNTLLVAAMSIPAAMAEEFERVVRAAQHVVWRIHKDWRTPGALDVHDNIRAFADSLRQSAQHSPASTGGVVSEVAQTRSTETWRLQVLRKVVDYGIARLNAVDDPSTAERRYVEICQLLHQCPAAQSTDVRGDVPLLSQHDIDFIANEGMRNAAGGIYATSVYDFARAVETAVRERLGRQPASVPTSSDQTQSQSRCSPSHLSGGGELPVFVRDTNPDGPRAAAMVSIFEQVVRHTPVLNKHLRLDRHPGPQIHYSDAKTHAIWVGWALGMRAAGRISVPVEAGS